MNLPSQRLSRSVGAALVTAALTVTLAGCSVSRPVSSPVSSLAGSGPVRQAEVASTTPPRASADPAGLTWLVLRVDAGLATATLDDTPAARKFAAMLPLQLTLHDPMGQAKSGRLPHRIDTAGADRVVDPEVAGIYYWPPSGHIGIVYDDLGQSVPPPGMVRLGSIDSGLDAIAASGNSFTAWIDAADRQAAMVEP